jgi:MurNAc alpha-1-phosphate uridylyltransferase
MKAMILAAGRGQRMRHLTEATAKPLLKIGKHTLIEHNILRLANAGVIDIVINIAYYADQIKAHLGDGSQLGVHISYSEEGEQPLGPGGGIVKALPLLGDTHFILMAADIWSDFPIATLFDKTKYLAHVVMTENPEFHGAGDYGIKEGFLTFDGPKFTYSGYSVWHPAIFNEHIAGEKAELVRFIEKAIGMGSATAELYNGNWHNVGTPEQLQMLGEQLQ